MLRALLFGGWVLLSSSLMAQSPSLSSDSSQQFTFSAERLQRIDKFLQSWVDAGKIPHAQSLVVHRGEVVHNQVYGTADAERQRPLADNAIWRIASQTKLITTLAVMMLYEEGKFLLDDPISRYISAFDSARVLVSHDSTTLAYETRPATRAITIRNLLTHTSGISYEHPLQDHLEFEVPFYTSLDDDLLEEVVDRIAARPLLHDPGEQFTYGLSTDVLGRLVEVVSGQSLATFFQQRIFAPLNMNDTYFYLPKDKEKRLVTLFRKERTDATLTVQEEPLYQNFARQGERTFYSGGAGLVSTAADYAKIGQLILNEGVYQGTRLLSPFTVRLMTRNQIGDLEVWDRHDKFGFGLQIITPDSRYGDLAPPGALTWGGLYCSEYTIDPANELVMQVYTNVYPFAHYSELVRTYRVLVYGAMIKGVD